MACAFRMAVRDPVSSDIPANKRAKPSLKARQNPEGKAESGKRKAESGKGGTARAASRHAAFSGVDEFWPMLAARGMLAERALPPLRSIAGIAGLAALAPFGAVLDDPVGQRALKSNVVAGLFRFDPFVFEDLIPFGL